MKIGIIIIVYNLDARIFIMQIEAIKKYCKDADYTIHVFDNGSDREKIEAIRHHAKSRVINYHKTNPSTKDPSFSHSFAANFSYKMLKDKYELLFYADHDLIPVKNYSIEEILGNHLVAGVRQGKKEYYLWPGCLIFRNNEIDHNLIDFSPNNKLRLDTGGELRKLIEVYGEERILYLDEIGAQNEAMLTHKDYYFYMMLCNETFIHFLAASNWSGKERHEERINSLINITTNLMAENDLRQQQQP